MHNQRPLTKIRYLLHHSCLRIIKWWSPVRWGRMRIIATTSRTFSVAVLIQSWTWSYSTFLKTTNQSLRSQIHLRRSTTDKESISIDSNMLQQVLSTFLSLRSWLLTSRTLWRMSLSSTFEHQQVIIFSTDSLSYWELLHLIYINTENNNSHARLSLSYHLCTYRSVLNIDKIKYIFPESLFLFISLYLRGFHIKY